MRSHSIWNNVYSDAYRESHSKSFGGRDDVDVDVRVGTGASNSQLNAEVSKASTLRKMLITVKTSDMKLIE